MKDLESKKKAIGTLIDGLSSARDRDALQTAILLFLRVSGRGKIKLEVPRTGITIVLEAMPNDGYLSVSQGVPLDGDVNWKSVMPKLIPACQAWMLGE